MGLSSYPYEDLDDLASKIDWEGGLFECAFEYGLPRDVLDPEQFPAFMKAWRDMFDAYDQHFGPAFKAVEKVINAITEV